MKQTYCESIGLKVGDRIRVLRGCVPFRTGSVITLKEDDDTTCPEFSGESLNGEGFDYFDIFDITGWERVADQQYPTEWNRHRGSKSMPKCLEGMRHEVMLRNGESIVVSDARYGMDWQNDNISHDITKYRILGPIEQAPEAADVAPEQVIVPAPEQPTIEKLIRKWQKASTGVLGLECALSKCKAEEQAAREAVQKALADAGWGDASTEPEKPSRSGQEVVWGEWEIGDVVVFDGYVGDGYNFNGYIFGKSYTVTKGWYGKIAPLGDHDFLPQENYGFRFIWP